MSWLSSKEEISKELYQELRSLSHEKMSNYIKNEIAANSGWHPMGYGFSSPELLKLDDKYYAKWTHWDSCD